MPVISNTDLAYKYFKELTTHLLNFSIFYYLVNFAATFFHLLSTILMKLCKFLDESFNNIILKTEHTSNLKMIHLLVKDLNFYIYILFILISPEN